MAESADPERPALDTIADRLNYLFEMARPRGQNRRYTAKEVVDGINAAGTELSTAHLSELRRGRKTNPTIRVLEALSVFFEVRTAYLVGDAAAVEEVNAELDLRRAMADAKINDIALRVGEMDPGDRATVLRIITEIVRKHNGT